MRKTIRLLSMAMGVLLTTSSCEKMDEPFDTEKNYVEVTAIRNSCERDLIYLILDDKKNYDPAKFIDAEPGGFMSHYVVIKQGDPKTPKIEWANGTGKKYKIKFRFEEPINFKEQQDPKFDCFGPITKMSAVSIIDIKE